MLQYGSYSMLINFELIFRLFERSWIAAMPFRFFLRDPRFRGNLALLGAILQIWFHTSMRGAIACPLPGAHSLRHTQKCASMARQRYIGIRFLAEVCEGTWDCRCETNDRATQRIHRRG